ncbi:Defensin-like protein 2 [Platanthera zijinensis]|uniref:Defensin-like protein 2 n=1 Tax=Platanthera zijinensis TaxID=2320716 RepID=A0AAP0BBI4_9ASPA
MSVRKKASSPLQSSVTMEFFKRMLPALLLVFLLLVASGMGPEMRAEAARPAGIPGIGEEKRTCESASYHFKGPCVSKSNCGHVCRTEGFPYGHCRGFRRRCFCTKPC